MAVVNTSFSYDSVSWYFCLNYLLEVFYWEHKFKRSNFQKVTIHHTTWTMQLFGNFFLPLCWFIDLKISMPPIPVWRFITTRLTHRVMYISNSAPTHCCLRVTFTVSNSWVIYLFTLWHQRPVSAVLLTRPRPGGRTLWRSSGIPSAYVRFNPTLWFMPRVLVCAHLCVQRAKTMCQCVGSNVFPSNISAVLTKWRVSLQLRSQLSSFPHISTIR